MKEMKKRNKRWEEEEKNRSKINDEEKWSEKGWMLWKEKKKLKGWNKKDMNDKVMIWKSEEYVAWLQKTQINSIFNLWENKTNKHKQRKNEN